MPELIPGGIGSDVVIRFAPIAHRPAREANCELLGDDEIYLRYTGVGTFRMLRGREVYVDAEPDASDFAVRLILTGPVLGLLLHQRRVLVLHASSIVAGAGAVGFLGASGVGKSTTAGAFHTRGYPLLSDDLLPVDLDNGCVVARSGFPQLKLWPQALEALGDDVEGLARLRPELEKRARPVGDLFQAQPLPLARLYVLADGPRLAIEPIASADSTIEFLRNTYAATVPELMVNPWTFESCSEVAERVSIRQLRRPATLTDLPELVRLVEKDLRT